MIDIRTLIYQSTGVAVTGYSIEAHTWYDGAVLADYGANTYSTLTHTYTDNNDGTYEADITTTGRYVLIAKNADGTAFLKVPQAVNGSLKLEGDNQTDFVP